MINLAVGKCAPCRGGDPSLTDAEVADLHLHTPQWQLKEVDGIQRLERVFKLKNYADALAFTNKVGAIAEEEDHHPLMILEWGRVSVRWWTHSINQT